MERFTLNIVDKPKWSLKNLCRLCGMDNPYKIQILRDDSFYFEDDIPLATKISACCGIQVTKRDKQSQKICNLCVDKINDFYEFREMCTATNLQTRERLGLPLEAPQQPPIVPPPVQNHIEDRARPSQTILQPPIIQEAKTQPVVRKKVVKKVIRKKVPRKAKATAAVRTKAEVEEVPLVPKLEPVSKPTSKPAPKPAEKPVPKAAKKVITKKKVKFAPPPAARGRKRSIPEDAAEPKTRTKKIKTDNVKVPPKVVKPLEIPMPQAKIVLQPVQMMKQKCSVCAVSVERQAMDTHMMEVHSPRTYEFGCGPCMVPFDSRDEYKVHQDWHRRFNIPYRCFKCQTSFPRLTGFTIHLSKSCVGNMESTNTVPNTQCTICGEEFATFNLYNWHGCFIKANSNCPKCNRFIQRKAVLFKHIFNCTGKGSFQREREMMEVKRETIEKQQMLEEKDSPSAVVKKVQPLKIKILDRKKYTATSGEPEPQSRVIKSEPDSTLEIEESQVAVEAPRLHTTIDDIRPPADEESRKVHKKKKLKTVKNPIAAMIRNIKQEPKDTWSNPVSIPSRVSAPRVKQEPLDNGYESEVQIAARNIKKERIDPPQNEPEQDDDAEEEEEEEQVENDKEDEEENLPALPQGVRIKQEPVDRATKPKPSTSKVTERAVVVKPEPVNTYARDEAAEKPAKKRIFKIPSALIKKLQQEKEKSQQKALEGSSNTVPVITCVRSIEQNDVPTTPAPQSPFVPVRIKSEFEKNRKRDAAANVPEKISDNSSHQEEKGSSEKQISTLAKSSNLIPEVSERDKVQKSIRSEDNQSSDKRSEKENSPEKSNIPAESIHVNDKFAENDQDTENNPERENSLEKHGDPEVGQESSYSEDSLKSTENIQNSEKSPEKENLPKDSEKAQESVQDSLKLAENMEECEESPNKENPVEQSTANNIQELNSEIESEKIPDILDTIADQEISKVSELSAENSVAEEPVGNSIPESLPLNGQDQSQNISEVDDNDSCMDSSQLDAPNILPENACEENGQPEQVPAASDQAQIEQDVEML
ncbi:hypothetical protein DMENIID0001_027110 [Sergentomyia squamirostris]